jgi:membrane protein DedA with SNARE-associated domain
MSGASTAFANLVQTLLGLLPSYGYTVLSVAAFASAAGFPLPVSLLLVAAGALASEGILDYLPAVLVVLLAAVAGDCSIYWLGRLVGQAIVERYGPRVGLSHARTAAASRTFARWGGGTVWITRWLVTAVGPAVSLIAGTEGYRFLSFLVFAVAGEALWASGYIGLGWLFGDNWNDLVDLIGNAVWLVTALVVAAVLGVVAWRLLRPSPAAPVQREST